MEKTVYLAVFLCHWSHGLDLDRVGAVAGMNCSYYLRHQQHSARMGGSLDSTNSASGDIPQLDCQPWFLPQKNDCEPGNHIGEVLQFQPGTNQTLLLPFYCMTTSENLTQHRDVLGGCLFTTSIPQEMLFFPLPCNISELNKFMCADLNREGQLCGSCQDGYAPPVYSYALHCVNCTDYGYQNWLKYVAVAFGPLTVFCVIIIVFHISATSPYLHGYILFCQLFSLPIIYRLFLTSHGYMYYKGTRWSVKIYSSFIGIWNLDFFRLVYEPFCLHPDMSVIQTLILDYLVALYPLLLVAITYSLVYLYGRNCKVVVLLWKPLRRILRPLFHDLDIRATLIESFSTLYLLSVVKIQSVSLDLLVPTPLYYSGGTQDSPYYLYLAPDVVYFGDTHLPYALVALVLSVALVIFPTLLLFLYPCQCFQTFLNKINCNSQVLRTYMDVLQGHYKNGTDNTRDFRYFSGVFLVVRIVSIIQFSLFNSYFSIITLGLCVTVLTFTVAILHPQRCHTHYILDSVFLSFLSVILFYTIGASTGTHNTVPSLVLMGLGIVSITSPQFYFIGLILYWTIRKKKIPQRIWAAIQRRINTDNHLINAVE
jgi:hypothetical protein